jgi:hypothetical protein
LDLEGDGDRDAITALDLEGDGDRDATTALDLEGDGVLEATTPFVLEGVLDGERVFVGVTEVDAPAGLDLVGVTEDATPAGRVGDGDREGTGDGEAAAQVSEMTKLPRDDPNPSSPTIKLPDPVNPWIIALVISEHAAP